jgi:hypothetical protein
MKKEKDDLLWQQAKARAGFKIHLTVYIIVMTTLWIIWLYAAGINEHPWPIYPTLGWGIGIIFNYLGAYKFSNAAEREYEKLKRDEANAAV